MSSTGEVCDSCFNTGTAVGDNGARPCRKCRPNRDAGRQQILLEKMPPRYQGVTLAGLQPDASLHPMQPEIVAYMKQNPGANYYFCGKNDVGKTHFLYALYEAAVCAGRNVIATTLHDWIQANIDSFRAHQQLATIRLVDLQQSQHPWTVCIDDVDKKKVTEFVADMFFNFVDSIYRYKHQLVVTSQLDPENEIDGRLALIDHFHEGDPKYGVGIARRLKNEETAVWRMF